MIEDVTAKKLSNDATNVASPSKASARVTLDPRTPPQLRLLVTFFSALEFGLNSLALYQHTPSFDTIKLSVESSCQSTFMLDHLLQILHILPDAYMFEITKQKQRKDEEKHRQQQQRAVLTIRKKRLQSTATTTTPNDPVEIETMAARIDAFCTKMNAFVHDHIAAIEKEFPKMTEQEVQAALKLVEVEKAPLPKLTKTSKPTLPSVENLTKPPIDTTVITKEMQVALAAPVPADLKSLPMWLIEKVRRQEQVQKKTTAKSDKALKQRVLTTLPQLSDQIESYALVKRKTVFPMEELIQNLSRAPIKGKVEEQIHLLETMVPFWITVVCNGGKEYVKLSRTHKYNVIKATIRKSIATMC